MKIPSLNERKDDIPLLVNKFLSDISKEYGNTKKEIDKKAIDFLKKQDWTGNIRQLRNVTERLIILGGESITESGAKNYF